MGIEHLTIDVDAAGDSQLRAAVAGQPIVVLAYTLVASEAVAVGFNDAGQALTGAMPFAANGGVSAPYCPLGHFATRPGQPLQIELASAVGVAGHLTIQVGGTLSR